MANTTPPLVVFITGDNVEDFEHPAHSPLAAADVLAEAVRRVDPSISSVTDSATTAVLFGPSLRYATLSYTEDHLHITAHDGTDGPSHTEAVTNWSDLTSLVATATRLARFLHSDKIIPTTTRKDPS